MRRAPHALAALLGAGLLALPEASGAAADDPVAATGAPADSADSDAPPDPWEGFNRPIFRFNDFLSRHALEPVGRGWRWLVPEFARRGLENLFENVGTPLVLVNDLLQGKPRAAGVDLARLLVNVSLGPAGLLLDPAQEELGLDPNDEDFGQTFGVWGIPAGPYLVLPLLGSSSPRDTAGLVVSSAAYYPLGLVVPFYATAGARAVDVVNTYSFSADDIATERAEAFDWYAAVRNAHVSHREDQVRDRAEPEEGSGDEDDDLYFSEDEEDPEE